MPVVAQGAAVPGTMVFSPASGLDIDQYLYWTVLFPGLTENDVKLRAVLKVTTETEIDGVLYRPVIHQVLLYDPVTEINRQRVAGNDAYSLGLYILENPGTFPGNPNWIIHGSQ